MNRSPLTRISLGPFLLDTHTHELWKNGFKIKLSGQPFEIFSLLLQNPGHLITREELRDLLWPGDAFVDFDHSLNAAINKLREALNDSADAPIYIETLPRRGYRFIAERSGPGFSSASAAATLATGRGIDSSSTDASSRHPYYLAAAVLLVLLLGGTLLLKSVSSNTTHTPVSSLQRIKPLTNLADETSQPAFSPSGEYVAFRRQASKPDASGVFVQSISSGNVVQLTRSEQDCCPAWSPDGRSIAFTRDTGKDISIHIVPFEPGGPAIAEVADRKVDTGGVAALRAEITWSPDGDSIVFTGASGLVLLSLHNSGTRLLTVASPVSEDWGPAFSPDGRQLLFVRSGDADFSDQLLTVPVAGGEVTQVATEHARILGPPQWSADGQSIIFASGRGSHPGLWRVSVNLRDVPVQINDSGWHPAISRATSRLAYQRITRSLNIWELDMTDSGSSSPQQARILVPSTSETDQGPAPQISPDETKLAFMSDRSGTMEIWVSDRDGSHPRQLTAIGDTGTPRWSPDSLSVVFDVQLRNGSAIYSTGLSGGVPRVLDQSEHEDVCPSFSHDGKWVYFASARTGQFQVWKVSAEGGPPVQVTRHGGHAAMASADGKFIYYAKTQYANPEIWQIPADGGEEKLLSPEVHPVTWASWSVVDRGVVFAGTSGRGKPVVSLYDTGTHRLTAIGTLNVVPFWFSSSRDGKSLLFDQPGWRQAQIMVVENFQ